MCIREDTTKEFHALHFLCCTKLNLEEQAAGCVEGVIQGPLMAIKDLFERDLNPVLFEENSCVGLVTLNRPQKLNSLTYDMVVQIEAAMKIYESDPRIKFVILKGKGKAFCAGGDILKAVQLSMAGDWSFTSRFHRRQLMLDYALATYTKPLVFLLNGIVMGGGAGLSMHGSFRIVTENTVFAMPEAAIGHFPDVGASYFLSRLPGHFGEYLGLTGAKIDGAEMLACGLATHFVYSKDLQALENALCKLVPSDKLAISQLIHKFIYKGDTKQDSFYKRLDIINKCFSGETVEEILLSLEEEVKGLADKWIVKAISSMKSASPTSLKIALRSIREGRMQNLEDCLTREYTISCHVFKRTVNNDFYEGIRAILEKDKKPQWVPSDLCQVCKEMVNQFFVKVDDDDWESLQLPPCRSRASKVMKAKI